MSAMYLVEMKRLSIIIISIPLSAYELKYMPKYTQYCSEDGCWIDIPHLGLVFYPLKHSNCTQNISISHSCLNVHCLRQKIERSTFPVKGDVMIIISPCFSKHFTYTSGPLPALMTLA